ncbi:hypothetical protein KOM01_017710 [Dyadobacter fermentans]|nr:hypothetical protein [Dyadobacter fermentans]MBZ1359683.1 hypothetical protein [Dyadobacter fermentans]
MQKDLMAPNWKILNGYRRKEAFGEKVLPFRIILIRVFLFDMYVEDIVMPVDGG